MTLQQKSFSHYGGGVTEQWRALKNLNNSVCAVVEIIIRTSWPYFHCIMLKCILQWLACCAPVSRYCHTPCLSVCLWRLWIVTIEVDAYQKIITLGTSLAATACPAIKVYGKFPNFQIKQSGVCKRQFFHRKSKIYLKRCSIQQKIQQSVDINLYSPYRLVT